MAWQSDVLYKVQNVSNNAASINVAAPSEIEGERHWQGGFNIGGIARN
jgi:hypothetical protein